MVQSNSINYRINLKQRRRLRPIGLSIVTAGLLLVLAMLFLSQRLQGADVMMMAPMEAHSDGNVSSAEILKPGEFGVGLYGEFARDPIPREIVLPSDAEVAQDESELAKAVTQFGVTVSTGVLSFLDFHLGIHGTQESISKESESRLFDHLQEDETTKVNAKPVDFSGASFLAKFALYDGEVIKLAMAPFAKTGGGESAKYAISRSESMTGGWMALITYQARDVAEININSGYRYRYREQIGDVSLRNELFYQASVEGIISKYASLYVAGLGRQLMIADETKQVSGENRKYSSKDSGEILLGLKARYRGFEVNTYGGQRFHEQAIGNGKISIGVGLSYVFGGKKIASSEEIFDRLEDPVKEDQKDDPQDEAKPASKDSEKENDNESKKPVVIDDEADDINLYEDAMQLDQQSEGKEIDDFQLIEKEMKDSKNQQNKEPSEAEKVERELRELKEAERKAEEAREKKRQKEIEIERKQMRERLQEDAKKEKQLRQEVLKDLKDAPSIDEEDASWNGLYN